MNINEFPRDGTEVSKKESVELNYSISPIFFDIVFYYVFGAMCANSIDKVAFIPKFPLNNCFFSIPKFAWKFS